MKVFIGAYVFDILSLCFCFLFPFSSFEAFVDIFGFISALAPQFPSELPPPPTSNEFKQRRASLNHRLPLSIAPQLINLELSPNENKAPESDYWAALKKLQISKKRQSMFVESTTEKPAQSQSLKSMKGQSASKLAPLSQLFQHLKGSKKDKSRRHTIYVAPNSKDKDVTIEPLKSVENTTKLEEKEGEIDDGKITILRENS